MLDTLEGAGWYQITCGSLHLIIINQTLSCMIKKYKCIQQCDVINCKLGDKNCNTKTYNMCCKLNPGTLNILRE